MYYDIAAYSVFFAAERLYYDTATYSVYDSVADLNLSKNSLLASDHRSEPITVHLFLSSPN